VIAIDGKTVRRSGRKQDNKAPIHMVSAFAARQRLVLGQVKVAKKIQRYHNDPQAFEHVGDRGGDRILRISFTARECAEMRDD
jgi:hypothetical protein